MKARNIWAILLALLLMLSAFAGCKDEAGDGNTPSGDTGNTGDTGSTDDTGDKNEDEKIDYDVKVPIGGLLDGLPQK